MTIAKSVVRLLRNNLSTGDIKTVRVGDPGQLANVDLPAIFVTEMQAAYTAGAMQMDTVTVQLLTQIVIDKRKMLGSKREPEDYLDDIIHGTDENNNLRPNTVIGVLRYNLTIDGWSIGNELTYIKDEFPRDEKTVTYEAHIDMTLTREVNVVNRT